MSDSRPVLLWLRRELRLADHPALTEACASGSPVIPVFILDETPPARPPGGASRWWLHHSLASLDRDISRLGGRLVLRRGHSVGALEDLVRETDARAVFWTRNHAPGDLAADTALRQRLERKLELHCLDGRLLFEPEQIRKKDGTPYRVFTPFWNACQAMPESRTPLPAPESWPAAAGTLPSDRLADWSLLPRGPDWAGGLRESWRPGEREALTRCADFLEADLARYPAKRDVPGDSGTSRLSPHLSWGEISPRQVSHMAQTHAAHSRSLAGTEALLRQLGWRDFCHHLLFHHPELAEQPLQEQFADFPWREDAALLEKWQQGRTGYPIIDAGMRELWTTGWMHNRVRMIVASFLVKDLLIPWQAGEAWFWDTLVDADPANNAANWQWVAGCGADAAPFFRIFNPSVQAQKFDPDGRYVRRWLPELADCPDECLHEPWLQPAGDDAGPDYPRPIVEHSEARERALTAYREMRDRAA